MANSGKLQNDFAHQFTLEYSPMRGYSLIQTRFNEWWNGRKFSFKNVTFA